MAYPRTNLHHFVRNRYSAVGFSVVWLLTLCSLLGGAIFLYSCLYTWADSLPNPYDARNAYRPSSRQTQGWVDIYLIHDRICKTCRMTDLGNERVWLENTEGLGEAVWSHEIMGLDTHPWQRKFLKHRVATEHPLVIQTLWPSAKSNRVGLIDAGTPTGGALPDF